MLKKKTQTLLSPMALSHGSDFQPCYPSWLKHSAGPLEGPAPSVSWFGKNTLESNFIKCFHWHPGVGLSVGPCFSAPLVSIKCAQFLFFFTCVANSFHGQVRGNDDLVHKTYPPTKSLIPGIPCILALIDCMRQISVLLLLKMLLVMQVRDMWHWTTKVSEWAGSRERLCVPVGFH